MIELNIDELRGCFGFGVAGNFAGHLEQAGEAADFVDVEGSEPEAPKGIFPWYVPGADSFLGDFPLSFDKIAKPPSDEPVNLQIEPEVGLLCDVYYSGDAVAALHPVALGAFNDCSIRRPGAKKISEKKNWGADSKGIARSFMSVTDLDPAGPTHALRIASFLLRDGALHAYGVDSAVVGYSYYGHRLLDWLVERLNLQQGSPETPLEPVGSYLRSAGAPRRVLIGIGATRYTPLGESTYLRAGDHSIVAVYDANAIGAEQLAETIGAGDAPDARHASVLRQLVYDARS